MIDLFWFTLISNMLTNIAAAYFGIILVVPWAHPKAPSQSIPIILLNLILGTGTLVVAYAFGTLGL